MPMTPATVWNRVFSDFLMPSRLERFRGLLDSALKADYRIVSVETFWGLLQAGTFDSGGERYLILRHDVDTDAATAAEMWRIERTLGVEASYYFRMTTLDYPLMRAIGSTGSQASYHFEDLATVVKRRHLRRRDEVLGGFAEGRDLFRHNLTNLREKTGLPMRVVASHGDFINRKIRIPNWALLTDRRFRLDVGVDLEAYDDDFMRHVTSRHADTGHPTYWTPESPLLAIERGEPVVYVLTHPRHWRSNRSGNLRDDLRRVNEGLDYVLAPTALSLKAIRRRASSTTEPQTNGPGAHAFAAPPGSDVAGIAVSMTAAKDLVKFVVRAPGRRSAERRYIFDVVFSDWLGVDYEYREEDRADVSVQLAADPDGPVVTLSDVLFATPDAAWLTERSMPAQPLTRIETTQLPEVRADLSDRKTRALPILYGGPSAAIGWQTTPTGLGLDIDVFGSVFFLLTRYEEVVRRIRDEHQRFPAFASLASAEGYLERAIADDYVDLLWGGLCATWPAIERRKTPFRLQLTHDVDQPWAAMGQPLSLVFRSLGADLFERHNPILAGTRGWSLLAANSGRISHDPFDTFDLLMTTSERHGLRSTFYFLAGPSGADLDGRYLLTDPAIARLLRSIAERGHQIGLHASYGSFNRPEQTTREFEVLRAACRVAGADQDEWGVRQHFLRFENPQTWRNHEVAGFSYDSTLGFADYVGFRAGTSREYQIFDLVDRRTMKLRERPLAVMDASLLGYMGLSLEQAAARAQHIVEVSKEHSGDAVICYHNSTLPGSRERAHYRELVAELVKLAPDPRPAIGRR